MGQGSLGFIIATSIQVNRRGCKLSQNFRALPSFPPFDSEGAMSIRESADFALFRSRNGLKVQPDRTHRE